MQKKLVLLNSMLLAGACLALPHAAYALNGTSNIEIDGGPLGPLEMNGGMDGYFYAQSNAKAGAKSTGANVDDFMLQLEKTTGPIQFDFQLAGYQAVTLGVGVPKQASITHFTTGPVRNANITIPLNSHLSITVGQMASLEGWESTFTWNNPTGVDTVLYYVTNSENRGVSATYTQGPASVQVIYGDGNDTGVWNFLQFLATYNFDANNNLNLFGGINLGFDGPNTFYYGQDTTGDGNMAYVNSNIFGGWFSSTMGNLTVTPEVQYQYAKPNMHYGPAFDIPKETSNFGAALFGQYNFGKSPYSLGGWVEYATSHGSAAQDDWFVSPNAELIGASIGPAWQYKNIYVRATGGYSHLLNVEAGKGYGNDGNGKDYVIGMLQGGLVF